MVVIHIWPIVILYHDKSERQCHEVVKISRRTEGLHARQIGTFLRMVTTNPLTNPSARMTRVWWELRFRKVAVVKETCRCYNRWPNSLPSGTRADKQQKDRRSSRKRASVGEDPESRIKNQAYRLKANSKNGWILQKETSNGVELEDPIRKTVRSSNSTPFEVSF